jgi:hypothetical protein
MFREKRIKVLFGILKIPCKETWGLTALFKDPVRTAL